MALPRRLRTVREYQTRALVLQRVAYGEADLIVTLMTEGLGRVSALARSARRSSRRFGGALEPVHTLRVHLDERSGVELCTLREAAIDTPRRHILRDLAALEAAGHALAWVRQLAPPRTEEPELWQAIMRLLERLDDGESQRGKALFLAEFGLELLTVLGFGLDFERCVRCGKECAEGQAALLGPSAGGLVCRGCGGAHLRLGAHLRRRLAKASRGDAPVLEPGDQELALEVVEQALRAHTGIG